MSIQETIANALALWSEKRAESTVRCQGTYFSLLLKTAGENGFDAPCQKLYDLFLEGAITPATRSSRTRIVKAVDLVAATHAVTSESSFLMNPLFQQEPKRVYYCPHCNTPYLRPLISVS